MKVEDFESLNTKQCLSWSREAGRHRNETSRSCLWRCLGTVEAGCQEETQKKKAEKKRRQARTKMQNRRHKEQPGKVSRKMGTARKSKTKKRRKRRTGRRTTRWKGNEMRM